MGDFAAAVAIGAIDEAENSEVVEDLADGGRGQAAQFLDDDLRRFAGMLGDKAEDLESGRRKAAGGGFGEGLIADGEPMLVVLEVSFGVEGDGIHMAGLDGGHANDGLTRRGVDSEHVVDAGSDGGGAAEETGLVGVVDDDDGSAGIESDGAQIAENGLHGKDAILVSADHDVGEGIDDDEAGLQGASVVDEVLGFGREPKVVAAGGDEEERRVFDGVVGNEGGMNALPEGKEASLFFDKKSGRLGDGETEPGLAHGYGNG